MQINEHTVTKEQLLTGLSKVAERSLDSETAKAFKEISRKGFKPFLVLGCSNSDLMAAYEIFGEWVLGSETPELDYTAFLVATDPEHTSENLRENGLCEQIAAIVPTGMHGVKIGEVKVCDYAGESIYHS
jgi:hypothetical protein